MKVSFRTLKLDGSTLVTVHESPNEVRSGFSDPIGGIGNPPTSFSMTFIQIFENESVDRFLCLKISQEYRSLRGNRAEPPDFHNWNSIKSTGPFFLNHLLFKKSRYIKIGRRIHFQIIVQTSSRNCTGGGRILRLAYSNFV